MKNILLISLFLIQNIAFGQENVMSKEFKLTTVDFSKIDSFYANDDGYAIIYLIDNSGNKIKELKVYAETYENNGVVEEILNTNLKNVKKVLKVRIFECACYCHKSTYFWVITEKNKWIELPTIEEGDYEIELKHKNYVFPKDNPNVIHLMEYQDEIIVQGVYDINNFRRKSEKIIKTMKWNGRRITN